MSPEVASQQKRGESSFMLRTFIQKDSPTGSRQVYFELFLAGGPKVRNFVGDRIYEFTRQCVQTILIWNSNIPASGFKLLPREMRFGVRRSHISRTAIFLTHDFLVGADLS